MYYDLISLLSMSKVITLLPDQQIHRTKDIIAYQIIRSINKFHKRVV